MFDRTFSTLSRPWPLSWMFTFNLLAFKMPSGMCPSGLLFICSCRFCVIFCLWLMSEDVRRREEASCLFLLWWRIWWRGSLLRECQSAMERIIILGLVNKNYCKVLGAGQIKPQQNTIMIYQLMIVSCRSISGQMQKSNIRISISIVHPLLVRVANVYVSSLQISLENALIEFVLHRQLTVCIELEVKSQQVRGDQQPSQTHQYTALLRCVIAEPVNALVEYDWQSRQKEQSHDTVVAELCLSGEVSGVCEKASEGVGSSQMSYILLERSIGEMLQTVVWLVSVPIQHQIILNASIIRPLNARWCLQHSYKNFVLSFSYCSSERQQVMQSVIVRLLFCVHFVNCDHILKQLLVFTVKLLQSHLRSSPGQIVYTPRQFSLQQIQSYISYCLQIVFPALSYTSQSCIRNKLMQSFICRVSFNFCKSSFYVAKSLHSSKSQQYDVAFESLHNVGGMEVPIKIAAVMYKLYASEYISEDLIWWQRNLAERILVHFQCHDVLRHRFVDIIYLVNANLLCLYDILPQSLIEGNEVLHGVWLCAVLDYDRFRALFVISWVDRLGNLSVLQLELFHIGLDFAYIQELLLFIGIVVYFPLQPRLSLWDFLLRTTLIIAVFSLVMQVPRFGLEMSDFFILSRHHIANILLLLFISVFLAILWLLLLP